MVQWAKQLRLTARTATPAYRQAGSIIMVLKYSIWVCAMAQVEDPALRGRHILSCSVHRAPACGRQAHYGTPSMDARHCVIAADVICHP